jgi:hypothetical protein
VADSNALLGYGQIVGELRRLCAERATGSVFITTSDNHAARFALASGAIIAVWFRQQTGPDALASIQRVTGGKLRYSEEVLTQEPQAALPSTTDLLALLEGGGNGNGAGPAAQIKSAESAVIAPQIRAIVEAELAEYLGPMASVIVTEQAAPASSVNDLIERVAAELGDAAKASRLKERLRERLPKKV